MYDNAACRAIMWLCTHRLYLSVTCWIEILQQAQMSIQSSGTAVFIIGLFIIRQSFTYSTLRLHKAEEKNKYMCILMNRELKSDWRWKCPRHYFLVYFTWSCWNSGLFVFKCWLWFQQSNANVAAEVCVEVLLLSLTLCGFLKTVTVVKPSWNIQRRGRTPQGFIWCHLSPSSQRGFFNKVWKHSQWHSPVRIKKVTQTTGEVG